MLQTSVGEQIKIIDNSTHLGKKTVESLCLEGYEPIGYIESEQPPLRLLRGFNKNMSDKLEQRDLKLWNIWKVLNDEAIVTVRKEDEKSKEWTSEDILKREA